MDARARLLGHPIHQMLIVLPLGLRTGAFFFDVVHDASDAPRWAEISYWLIIEGLAGGVLAAIVGRIDWLAIPSRTRARCIGADNAVAMQPVGNTLGGTMRHPRGEQLGSEQRIAAVIRENACTWSAWETERIDAVVRIVGGADVVPLGEATHETREFYPMRAGISLALINAGRCDAVLVEGDCPDAYRENRYAQDRPGDDDAVAAPGDFRRFRTGCGATPRWSGSLSRCDRPTPAARPTVGWVPPGSSPRPFRPGSDELPRWPLPCGDRRGEMVPEIRR